MPTPLTPPPQVAAVHRDRGDACPGSLRLHTADDGALARVRVPGGVVTVEQAEALATAARWGDGDLHLTSRGNVQVRGLDAGRGPELAGLLDAAGLLPAPGHERVRNVVASPLSGLDGGGEREVRPWLTELDAALCASPAARELSGRFLFALDDGRGDVAGLGADVTVRAAAGGAALLGVGASREVLRLAAGDAPRAALLAAEEFLAAAGKRAWRVAELGTAPEALLEAVGKRLAGAGVAWARVPAATGRAPEPAPGAAGTALCAHARFGRITAVQWRELIRAAARGTGGELRLTPWRSVVVPAAGLDAAGRAAALADLAATGLVTDPASPWPLVGACVGRPGCARSHADVRADAARALTGPAPGPDGPAPGASDIAGPAPGTALPTGPASGAPTPDAPDPDARVPDIPAPGVPAPDVPAPDNPAPDAPAARPPLPLYWSGCERRCGRPRGPHLDLVAVPDGGYLLTAAGDGPSPTVALSGPSGLAAALADLAP
ncbi:cobalamin biosynthesis protein CobG [Streptomyces sp. NPDC052077]|uniref:cobalamin biosynthesis protein CobG n=1 Tax=Streptomyces sp. NPDC052077 TaxID=3154757 RepID=UPI003446ADE8